MKIHFLINKFLSKMSSLLLLLLSVFVFVSSVAILFSMNINATAPVDAFMSEQALNPFQAHLFSISGFVLVIVSPINWILLNDVEKGTLFIFGGSNGARRCLDWETPVSEIKPDSPLVETRCWPAQLSNVLSIFDDDGGRGDGNYDSSVIREKIDIPLTKDKVNVVDVINFLVSKGYLSNENFKNGGDGAKRRLKKFDTFNG